MQLSIKAKEGIVSEARVLRGSEGNPRWMELALSREKDNAFLG